MANHRGSEGVVKVGSNTVAEVKSWTLSEETETIEDTAMGDTARTYQLGLQTWSGSLECFWDETDSSGQGALTNSATATLNLYPEGASSSDTYYTGSIIVTSIERTAALDGMVEATIGFTGTAGLASATV